MTTNLIDIQNSDVVMATSNMAENHPVGFQWLLRAKERGAKFIHVDPRFTRTSALADIHVPLRSGTNIVFFGGLINYAITRRIKAMADEGQRSEEELDQVLREGVTA